MNFIEIGKKINKDTSPIYVIIGQDSYLISKTISHLKKVLIENFEELNFNLFDDENFSISNIITCANGMPFSNAKKLIIVKNISGLTKEDESKLNEYAKNPNPTSCVVFVSNNKFFKDLKNSNQINCSNLSLIDMQKLIASLLKKDEKSITIEASTSLCEHCDYDAGKVAGEIEKLISYSQDENLITKEMVDFVTTRSFDDDVFHLINALSNKNAQIVLKTLADLFASKAQPTMILSAIINNFRRMFLSSISTNLSNEQIANELNVKPFAITKAKENAKKFSIKNLKRINELLTETEFMLKNGLMSSNNVIYYLVFNILIY